MADAADTKSMPLSPRGKKKRSTHLHEIITAKFSLQQGRRHAKIDNDESITAAPHLPGWVNAVIKQAAWLRRSMLIALRVV